MLGARILALHCWVFQATDGRCEVSLPEAGASRSANKQVTHPPHAIPAAIAPLGCALRPDIRRQWLPPHVLQPTLQRLPSEFIQIHPLFNRSFFHVAVLSYRVEVRVRLVQVQGKHFIVARDV